MIPELISLQLPVRIFYFRKCLYNCFWGCVLWIIHYHYLWFMTKSKSTYVWWNSCKFCEISEIASKPNLLDTYRIFTSNIGKWFYSTRHLLKQWEWRDCVWGWKIVMCCFFLILLFFVITIECFTSTNSDGTFCMDTYSLMLFTSVWWIFISNSSKCFIVFMQIMRQRNLSLQTGCLGQPLCRYLSMHHYFFS